MQLTRWVLCKIYKKVTKPANNNVGDQEEAFEEQNQQLQDEPLQPMAMFYGSKLTQPAVQDPPQAFAMDQDQQSVGNSTLVYYQNLSRPTSINGFQFSCGASSSSSKRSPPAIVEPGDNDMAPVPHEEDIYDNPAPLDDFMISPAQALAVQMDTSSNPMTMQQMASSQTLSDEVLQL